MIVAFVAKVIPLELMKRQAQEPGVFGWVAGVGPLRRFVPVA
jgi:hypothetical protein